MRKILLFLFVLCLAFVGCEQTGQVEEVPVKIVEQTVSASGEVPQEIKEEPKPQKPENVFHTFYLYADKGSRSNHYIPSGFMPNGKCLKLVDRWRDGCQSGKTCMKIVYDIPCSLEDERWSGIYWLHPPNNWGNVKGGYNLNGATKFTFWARGEEGGEQIEEFKIGGIYGEYPDSDMAMIGPVILAKEWRQYTIDLRGKDLSYISGGFSWSTNVDVNPTQCIFYLDNLKYE